MTATHYSDWLTELKKHFPVAAEYELAAAIYPFPADFEEGCSPRESYQRFDAFASCDDEAA